MHDATRPSDELDLSPDASDDPDVRPANKTCLRKSPIVFSLDQLNELRSHFVHNLESAFVNTLVTSELSLPFYAQIFSQLSILGIRIFPRNLRDLRLMLVPQVKLIIFSFDKVRQTTKI